MGLRKDKPARDVRHPTLIAPSSHLSTKTKTKRRDKPRPRSRDDRAARRVPPQNIMHLLPDAVIPDRHQLVSYWRSVGRRALKHLAKRPLTLVRSVNGVTFFHKGPLPPIPDADHQLRIAKREGGEGVRVWVDDLAGLLALLEMDAVEIHPWGSTVNDIERPDLLIFDLDPGAGVEWEFVTETAIQMRYVLRKIGHRPWVKTSGGKGLHVMVPVARDRLWDEARSWARDFAAEFAKRDRRYTISSTVNRKGRLFIDYLRNGRGSSAVGVFSPRVRPGFPVSYPVTWNEVENGVTPDAMTLSKLTRIRK
jgi:bifunctional non-homologous end joining protein LigD